MYSIRYRDLCQRALGPDGPKKVNNRHSGDVFACSAGKPFISRIWHRDLRELKSASAGSPGTRNCFRGKPRNSKVLPREALQRNSKVLPRDPWNVKVLPWEVKLKVLPREALEPQSASAESPGTQKCFHGKPWHSKVLPRAALELTSASEGSPIIPALYFLNLVPRFSRMGTWPRRTQKGP